MWLVQPTVLDFLFFNCGFFLLQRFQQNFAQRALGDAVVAGLIQVVFYAAVLHFHQVALVGGVTQGDHAAQAHLFGQSQQLCQGRAVDGPHDAAAHTVGPGGSGQAAQGKARVHIIGTGQVFVLQYGDKRRRHLVGLGGALLPGQIGGPVYQRLHGGHSFGALHDDILHRLAVGAAAGDAGGVHTLLQNFRRHGALLEPAVGAARAQKLHHIHSQHILASCLCRALPGRHKAAAVLLGNTA